MTKKDPPPTLPVLWWDRVHEHPLSDAQFVEAFCAHVLLTTEDRELRIIRDRAFRFIRNFMAPVLEAELTTYRTVRG